MKLILLESYEADLSNSGYNIQFGEELTEIQTNLYSVCKHSDTFLAYCTSDKGHTWLFHSAHLNLPYPVCDTLGSKLNIKKDVCWDKTRNVSSCIHFLAVRLCLNTVRQCFLSNHKLLFE